LIDRCRLTDKSPIFLLFLFLLLFCDQHAIAQEQALDMEEKYMDSLLSLSYDLGTTGQYKEAFELNIKTLQIALNKENDNYTGIAYGYLGYDLLEQGDTIEAIKKFKLAHKYAVLADDPKLIAHTYSDLATVYYNRPKMKSLSKLYTDRAVKTFKDVKDTLALQHLYYNYAYALGTNHEYEEMKTVLDDLNGDMFIDYTNHIYRAIIDNLSAEYHLYHENYRMADSLLLSVIELSKKTGLSGELEISYEAYSKSLAAQGIHKKAFEYRLKYEKVQSLNLKEKNDITKNRIAATFQINEFKKDLERSEVANVLQEKKIYHKTLFNYALTALSIIALLGFYFTFNLSRNRKQLNRALKEKNKLYLEEKTKTEKLACAKSDFFSTVSHELRTPLYGVIGLSNILLDNNKDPNITEDLKSLKFSADYLLALINDVLQINKIDSNKIDDEQIDFNLDQLIHKIVSTFEYMRRQNKNEIETHLPPDLPELIHGNATRLSQILMNLIGNASKFTENGVIHISVVIKNIQENKITLGFSIKDNGEGIAVSKQNQIFEEFEQGDSLSYNYQGTGLGLPIVKRLLTLSNSRIHLDTQVGEGSNFTFDLEYDNVAADQLNNHTFQKPLLLETSILHGKHILIAEDNRINQMVTKKILEKDGVICTVVENGKEAVASCKTVGYDLILMDVNMPVMGGIDATKSIRLNCNIPIIALTAVEIEEMRQSILDSGMNDIIIKPYDVNAFKRVIIKNILDYQKTQRLI
jgi:signal transduction histidine kinase/ActR/RegA family two-component response regulator